MVRRQKVPLLYCVSLFSLIIKGILLHDPAEPIPEVTAAVARPAAVEKLGEMLIASGKLDPANLDRALKVQESALNASDAREKLGSILTRMGVPVPATMTAKPFMSA